jgi:hypothetical protein
MFHVNNSTGVNYSKPVVMAQVSFERRNKAVVSKMIMMTIMKMGDADDGEEVEVIV